MCQDTTLHIWNFILFFLNGCENIFQYIGETSMSIKDRVVQHQQCSFHMPYMILLQTVHCIKTGCVLLIAHNCDDKEMKKYYNGYYQLFGY